MNIKNILMFVMSICLGVSFNVSAHSNGGGEHYVLNLVGAGEMYESYVPDLNDDGSDDPAICFDTQLVDMKTQETIGTATDCLSNVTPTGSGLALIGTSYFFMENGTLITRGATTVQTVYQPTVTPYGQVITHITGASSDLNAIIGGTGDFANRTGTARLSGMVDMTDFTGAVGDRITFDCLFVIDLD